MKYDIGTIFRALFAAFAAGAGAAATAGNDPTGVNTLDAAQWLTVLGTGAVAAGALLHPNKKAPANEKAVTTLNDVTAAVSKAHKDLTDEAVASIKKVQDAVGEVTAQLGPVGPLTQQVINSLPKG